MTAFDALVAEAARLAVLYPVSDPAELEAAERRLLARLRSEVEQAENSPIPGTVPPQPCAGRTVPAQTARPETTTAPQAGQGTGQVSRAEPPARDTTPVDTHHQDHEPDEVDR